jgi:FkbH-like protein
VLRGHEMLARYPVADVDDQAATALGHVPYTRTFFAAFGTLIARQHYALQQAAYKVIALDCDETLWKGVCGEVGPQGIELDAPRLAVQRFAVAQQQHGMLLCLCSKNNEEDVAAVFDARPEMPLRKEHIVASRVNWKPKSENLRSLAAELRLGLDSFILLDDDPVACAEVQANCPEVLTLQLPTAADLPRFLDHIWATDGARPTEEDAQRTERYRQELARERSRKEAFGLQDFFATLALEVDIQPIGAGTVPRVAQLTQRTNQFNCTTIRRTEPDLARLLADGKLEGLVVDVTDRFGAYGLVGVLLFHVSARRLVVETFLLSCRALGRGVEHRMVSRIGQIAKERGCQQVDFMFRPSGKNTPALEFLTGLKASRFPDGDDTVFSLSDDDAIAVGFTPRDGEDGGSSVQPQPQRHPAGRGAAPSALMRRIATELTDAEQIRRAIDDARRRRRPAVGEYVAPRTPMEATVADIWREILGLDRVGIRDDFFALGGHSLLATLLVARVRDMAPVELSFDTFFAHPTVEGIAQWIQDARIGHASRGELSDLLEDMDRLSDEEVAAMLQEQDGIAG